MGPVLCWGPFEGFGPALWHALHEEAEDLSGPTEAFLTSMDFVCSLQALLAKAVAFFCSPQPVPFGVTDLDCLPVPCISSHFSRGQVQCQP